MSNILVVGTGPLYSPEIRQFCGQSLRTWHITKVLLDAGHHVNLLVLPTDGYRFENQPSLVGSARYEDFDYNVINSHVPSEVVPEIERVLKQKTFDAIVAVNLNAANIVCLASTKLPIWCDLLGHVMGEAQAKCYLHKSDTTLNHFWQRESRVLRRADRLSASSHKQMYAVLGEMGSLGRLNQFTCAHPFVSVMPIAADEQFSKMDLQFREKSFRGPVFPEDAFAVLWTGGYNTWTDIRSLAGALSLAMEQTPRLHFVSTGGAIPGHDEITYPAFREEMQRTGFADRCHFLGWIEGERLPSLYSECDLGLNMDGLNYETLFGARNRLTNLMAAGVPILTTLGTEITEIISDNRLGYTVRIGRVQEYADLIVRAFRTPKERRSLANRAKNYVREHYRPEIVAKPLLRWAAHPLRAPDNEEKLRLNPSLANPADASLSSLEQDSLLLQNDGFSELESLRAENKRMQQELDTLKGSRLVKLRGKIRRIRKRPD